MSALNLAPLECERANCPCQRTARAGRGVTHCPGPSHANRDDNPSLSLFEGKDGKLHWDCKAGCDSIELTRALREAGVLGGAHISPSVSPATAQPLGKIEAKTGGKPGAPAVAGEDAVAQPVGLTLDALAEAKKLPVDFLRSLGLRTQRVQSTARVVIPYSDTGGNEAAVRYRVALHGQRFFWRKGDKALPYGLERLRDARKLGWVLIVEGESDCWTAWHHGLPAYGVPGKATWRPEWAEHLRGLEIVIWQEPGAEDFTVRIGADCPDARVIIAPAGCKDISEAHIQGQAVPELIENLRSTAPTARELAAKARERQLEAAHRAALPVLEAGDPLPLIQAAIRAQGYGGDLDPAVLTYLAATTRTLAFRHGEMLAHTLLLGPASAGKSFTWQVVRGLLPPEAYHEIDAGSPRTLIYDASDLQHRVVVFGEADSLPAGEDNPAASAIRNLLQDGYLHYSVTVRDPETGDFTVREISKPGPSVLVTTAVRPLGAQLMSRLFALNVPDGPEQVRAALGAQADRELAATPAPAPEPLIAFQSLLQARAPIGVVVPFVREIAAHLGRQPMASRVTRDFARLIALTKAVTVLRSHLRRSDASGRLIAEVADYAVVYELLADRFEAATGGPGESVRVAVKAVAEIRSDNQEGLCRVTDVAARLKVHKSTARRHVDAAIRGGWLINDESRKGQPANLRVGDPLPTEGGLPSPEALSGCATATTRATEDATATDALPRLETPAFEDTGCAVAPLTGEDMRPATDQDDGPPRDFDWLDDDLVEALAAEEDESWTP